MKGYFPFLMANILLGPNPSLSQLNRSKCKYHRQVMNYESKIMRWKCSWSCLDNIIYLNLTVQAYLWKLHSSFSGRLGDVVTWLCRLYYWSLSYANFLATLTNISRQFLMSSVHTLLGLTLFLFPSSSPSKIVFSIPSCLLMCLKKITFNFFF